MTSTAMVVALFLWPLVTRRWRTALLVYVLLMALALVYTGEHYVVDVVAGWLTAGAAVAVAAAVRRRRPRPPSPEDTVATEPLSASCRPV